MFGSNQPSPEAAQVLDICIYGPYRGECQDILYRVKEFLQEKGYERTFLACDAPSLPDSIGGGNFIESVGSMYRANCAIFIFLEGTESRLNGQNSGEINGSVYTELTHWCEFMAHEKLGTLVIFEGDTSNVGSLPFDLCEIAGAEIYAPDLGEIEHIEEKCLTTCLNWTKEI